MALEAIDQWERPSGVPHPRRRRIPGASYSRDAAGHQGETDQSERPSRVLQVGRDRLASLPSTFGLIGTSRCHAFVTNEEKKPGADLSMT